MNWLDEYPELAQYLIKLNNNTDVSQRYWSEFIDELRVELDKPRCSCKFKSGQFDLDFDFGDKE
tara:strand:+ start:658 stop:849 length:192 start_codon:yes stop_codon:yes gene_type:complete